MQLFVKRFAKHKRRYLFLIFSLAIIQGVILFGLLNRKWMVERFEATSPFEIENLYQLEVLKLNVETQLMEPIVLNRSMIRKIEAIQGVDNSCIGMPEPIHKSSARFFANRGYFFPNTFEKLKDDVSGEEVFMVPVAVSPTFERVLNVKLLKGTYFKIPITELNQVVVSKTLAQKLSLMNKDLPCSIILPYVKEDKRKEVKVCGIVEDVIFNNYRIKENAYACFKVKPSQKNATLKVTSKSALTRIETALVDLFKNEIDQTIQVRVSSYASIMQMMFKDEMHKYMPMVWLIPIVIFYSVIAIFGLFWNDVKSRNIDFGVLQAVGIRISILCRSVLIEGVCLASIGGVLNALLVFNIARIEREILLNNSGSELLFYWLLSFVAALVMILIATMLPAMQLLRMSPIKALSNE